LPFRLNSMTDEIWFFHTGRERDQAVLIMAFLYLERWYLVLGGVAIRHGFEPQSDLELFFAEISICN
jgi:hypothetical protein